MKLAIRVTVFDLSALTNAYVSVLSATGSLLISGASRCDDTRSALRGVIEAGHEVLVVDDDLPLTHEQRDLGGAYIRDVGDERSLRVADVRWRRGGSSRRHRRCHPGRGSANSGD